MKCEGLRQDKMSGLLVLVLLFTTHVTVQVLYYVVRQPFTPTASCDTWWPNAQIYFWNTKPMKHRVFFFKKNFTGSLSKGLSHYLYLKIYFSFLHKSRNKGLLSSNSVF